VREIGLVGEVVIEGALRDTGAREDRVESRPLVAMAMDLLECGGDESLARGLGGAHAARTGSCS
jgi:hypothetical protein